MANRGRFKGFRTEATVAKMTPEEQKIYRDFVKEVENAQRNNLPLPEPPKFSTDKPEKPVGATTGKRRGRKPGSKKINGKMVSAEEYEKIKNGIVNDVVDKAIARNKAENGEDEEDMEDIMDDADDTLDDSSDAAESKREQLVSEILESHTKYQEENIFAKATEDKQWYDFNDAKSDVQETVIHHCSREGFCIIETNEYFWLKRIKKMIDKCPDKVIVMPEFSSEDMLRVKVPYAAMKKVMVSTRTMTEEQRQRMSELGKSRKKKMDKETEETVENTEEIVEEDTTNTTEVIPESTTKTTPEPVVEGLAGKMMQTLTTDDTPTQGFTEVSEDDESEEDEEVEHVEAELVEPTEQNHGYDEEEEEGEDEFEYEPASLNGGGNTDDDDEVVFERAYNRRFASGQGFLQLISTYPWGMG